MCLSVHNKKGVDRTIKVKRPFLEQRNMFGARIKIIWEEQLVDLFKMSFLKRERKYKKFRKLGLNFPFRCCRLSEFWHSRLDHFILNKLACKDNLILLSLNKPGVITTCHCKRLFSSLLQLRDLAHPVP